MRDWLPPVRMMDLTAQQQQQHSHPTLQQNIVYWQITAINGPQQQQQSSTSHLQIYDFFGIVWTAHKRSHR